MSQIPKAKLNLSRFFTGVGPETGPILLDRRRVYILPSRSGVIFALVLFAMLLGAINYSNSLAHALTFLLASLGTVSMLHTFRNLRGLKFHPGQCHSVFAGETALFPLRIENNGDPRFAIKLAWPGQAPIIVDLAASDSRWINLPCPTSQRGRLKMQKANIYSRFPLGIFHAWGHVQFKTECIIYPRPSPERELPLQSISHSEAQGDRGRGSDDFASLRSYHAGDSLRHVHWKAFAREQGLLTKQFGGEQTDELWLNWEALAGLDVETRLSRLCRWILEADKLGLDYGLSLPDKQLPPGHGETHRHACLKALALFGNESK
ncbi:MAG: DUF58 domain-containing protein [Gammaproteobacteria bacterium]|nr:DUF58 domain-containing protein [Gammaproteobacteria bacterium]